MEDKDKSIHELAKENPDKTYNELTKIQEDAKLKKEGVCVTAALKKDLEGPTVFDEERKKFKKEIDYHRYWQKRAEEAEDKLKSRDYTKQHDYKFLVDENKKLHKEVDELKQDNKRLAHHIENQMDRTRKAGM